MAASPERYLIVRLSALGDIVHALPLLAALRHARPEAEIDWLAEPLGARLLLAGHPQIAQLHVVPKKAMKENFIKAWGGPMRELADALRARNYTAAIDVQGLTKSAFWPWKAGVAQRVGFAGAQSREAAGLLNTLRIEPAPDRLHVVERNLALLAGVGVAQPDRIAFPVHLPRAAEARADEILGTHAGIKSAAPLILIAPGAGWATKRWGAAKFGELAKIFKERHEARVGVAWGPGEEDLARDVVRMSGALAPAASPSIPSALPAEPGVYLLPSTSLLELGALAKRARLFVGGDTGPTHLAAALETPTVSMMGPLDARRNGPYGAHCKTVQHAVPRKAPWWANHRRWVDPATDIHRISVEEVAAACEQMLGGDWLAG